MSKSNQGARYIAIEVLCRWEESHLPIDQLMEQYLSNIILSDPRDRQLIKSLVYGVLRWRGYLDWVIGKFSKHPLAKMKNRTLQALRVGILQLLFMDRMPASAAINETVQALKEMKQPKWICGFTNGLLRTVGRESKNIPSPLHSENVASLPEPAQVSHPGWLVKRWKKRYGNAETAQLCRKNNTEAPLCIRVNSTSITILGLLEKLKTAGIKAGPGKYSPLAITLAGFHGPIPSIPGFTEGYFQVQDEAAQLVSLLLGTLQPGNTYLDGCAGLGGKTTHLAQMLPNESRLVAVEPNLWRMNKLKENLGRLQLDRTVTIVEGTIDSLLPDNKEKFAGILIDAPCSGLGVIRRHPDIRWNRTADDLLRYQETQYGLLRAAAELLAPEGIIVYATCSTEPEENDEVVKKFLAAQPHFALLDCRNVLPKNGACLVDSQGFFRTLPGQDDLDGFFAARLVKLSAYKTADD